jgi:hypothetical protein
MTETTSTTPPPLAGVKPGQTVPNRPELLRIENCYEKVFPDKGNRPSLRTFHDWKNRGFFPQVKIGKMVFLNPDAVYAALVKKFETEGTPEK